LILSQLITSGDDFQNLDFEEGPAYDEGGYTQYPDVMPGWILSVPRTGQTNAYCNNFILDYPAVALLTTDSRLFQDYVISGQRSVFLQATDYYQVGGLDTLVSISQMGTVPLGSQSLVFDSRNPWYGPLGEGFPVPPGPFNVTMDGVPLVLIPLTSDGGANVTYGADISSWTGQSVVLSIGVLPSPAWGGFGWEGWASVDSIRFSSGVVPEPTALSLFCIGLIGLGWHWRRQH
jgi:hypothetical protein